MTAPCELPARTRDSSECYSGGGALVKRSDSPQVDKAREAANEVGDQVASVTKDLTDVAAAAMADFVTGAARSLLPASVTGASAKKRGDR